MSSHVVEDRPMYKEYTDFIAKVGHGKVDNVDVTHDGYPLTAKEAQFIDMFLVNGNLNKCLRDAGLSLRNIAGKEYITDEISYRLEKIKKDSIADADEIMQYFTRVMRNEEKDQFGLDAPLSERTKAAQELAKRIIDITNDVEVAVPEIKITLNWEGM